mmetsp:Transcript_14495/g.28098  ORF Transcript_14495/g.28098 Transcript_14495/m.28098 type:complete len:103 (+) Transcript_14495:169-477(+)
MERLKQAFYYAGSLLLDVHGTDQSNRFTYYAVFLPLFLQLLKRTCSSSQGRHFTCPAVSLPLLPAAVAVAAAAAAACWRPAKRGRNLMVATSWSTSLHPCNL